MQTTTRLVWDQCRSSAAASAGVREQTTFHADNGCPALRQRIIHVEPGSTAGFPPASGDDVLFVLAGEGRLRLGAGDDHTLVPETGIYVQPGESYEIVADGDSTLELVAVEVPDPPSGVDVGSRQVTLSLHDAEAQQATANREFRLVVTPEAGLPVGHAVRRVHPGRAGARPLPHLRRGAVHPERGGGAAHRRLARARHRGRLHPLLAGAGALARELGQRADAGARGVPPGGVAVRGVLPGRHARDVLIDRVAVGASWWRDRVAVAVSWWR